MTRARDLADSADKDIAGTLTLDGLTVDGASVLIGHDTSQTIGGNESTAQITGIDGGAALSIARHQASTGGPSLRFGKSRVSTKGDVTIVQDGDQLGRIEFDGADGTDLVTKGAQIEAVVDGTPSADDMPTRLVFSTTADGASSPTERMRLNASGKLSLGNNLTNPDNSLLHLTQNSVDNFSLLQLESNEGSSATAPDMVFYRNSASPADDDNVGAIQFYSNNSAGERIQFGSFYNQLTDVTDGDEDSKLKMFAQQGGSLREFLTVGSNAGGTGEVVVNEASADINFRVETDANANAFVVDAGANFIGMHTGSALAPNGYTEQVRIASDGSNLGGSLVMSANNASRTGNSAENDIVFYDQDSAAANQQAIGNIRWYGLDPSGPGEGFKMGIKGRAQADGSALLEFYASSTTSNYDKTLSVSASQTHAGADNVRDLGSSGVRWDDVYATNSTINTSDERLKQQVATLSTNEINAAKAISALFKTYKWNDKVAEKGDNARIHSGVIAQQVKAAMEANSLDPMKYAFMCWNEFYEKEMSGEDIATPYVETFEVDDPEIPEGATYVDRYSIRYSELMSFIHAATEQRLASIETRLDALEAE